MMDLARSAWRSLAPRPLRRLGHPAARMLALRRVRAALKREEPSFTSGPVILSGLVSDTKGVSQAARLTLVGLEAAGLAPVVQDLRSLFRGRLVRPSDLSAGPQGGVFIQHVNAPEGIAELAAISPDDWRGRHRIGYWAYELPRLPDDWVKASAAYHEIWTPSRFVAEAAVASGVTKPVRVMPHPVSLGPQTGRRSRQQFSLSEDNLVILAMGDLLSSAERKNLIGAIRIFRSAFPAAGEATLIIKTQSGEAHPRFAQLARAAAEGRPDIRFLDTTVSEAAVADLIASSDILLSPHRAEGFGLPLAEAFLMGVPALATGWSGNLDFMAGVPELLIRHSLVPVKDPYGVYQAPGLEWAEPDPGDAVVKLRALAQSRDLRKVLAQRGCLAVRALEKAWSQDALKATPWGGLAGWRSPGVDGSLSQG